MSDTADDLDFRGRQLLNQSQVTHLREKMEAFTAESDSEPDLEALRERTSGGADLSDLVSEDRDERL